MRRFDAVVVSDLHLGARNSRGDDFLRFLDQIDTRRLIVAGDLFDDPRLRGLRARDIRVLRALRDFAASSHVDWLQGNHDPSPAWFAGLLSIELRDEAVLQVGGDRYLIYHGHGWDKALEWPRIVTRAADWCYRTSQRLDHTHRLARWLKHKSKRFLKAVELLRTRAIAEARSRSFTGVIAGHMHLAEEATAYGVHYLNCGCWTEVPSTFVGIRDGEAQLHLWDASRRSSGMQPASLLTGWRRGLSTANELASTATVSTSAQLPAKGLLPAA